MFCFRSFFVLRSSFLLLEPKCPLQGSLEPKYPYNEPKSTRRRHWPGAFGASGEPLELKSLLQPFNKALTRTPGALEAQIHAQTGIGPEPSGAARSPGAQIHAQKALPLSSGISWNPNSSTTTPNPRAEGIRLEPPGNPWISIPLYKLLWNPNLPDNEPKSTRKSIGPEPLVAGLEFLGKPWNLNSPYNSLPKALTRTPGAFGTQIHAQKGVVPEPPGASECL